MSFKLVSNLTLSISLGLFVASCAKEKPFETVYKEAELMQRDAVVDTQSTFLYVPSTLGAPKDVEAAMPFYKGDEKIVKFKFTEKSLDIVEVERDSRFQDNEMNNTPVLSIPVDYKDFRCTTNRTTGECLNKEEENTETIWSNKKFFKPDFASLQINEVNSLDLFNLDPSCISEVGTGLVNYEMSKDVLNIELEKTYKVSSSYECIANLYYGDQLGKAGFKMRFFYSLVRLDKVISPDYKAVTYPIQDQHRFGFFNTKKSVLDNVYDSSRPVESYLMHRWNPERGVITYFMSESFNKSENALLKDAALKAFDRINEGLKEAKSNIQLKLEEPKKDLIIGDIRYSSLNLIDDPLANGLLGYGPVVVNPLTGEIVKGHVNMYGGVLMTTVRGTYEAMVDLSKERVGTQEAKTVLLSKSAFSSSSFQKAHQSSAAKEKLQKFVENGSSLLSKKSLQKIAAFKNKGAVLEKERLANLSKIAMLSDKDKDDEIDLGKSEEKRLTHLGKMAACSADLISVPELAKKEFPAIRKIDDIANSDGSLKLWDELSESQRKQVIDAIMPVIFTSTLIHEMGHNLGLRHNFMGSFDKENFYTDEEASARGFHTTPVYSSIMDYGYSELNALTSGFGKYDIAALRFAYAREVEGADGEMIKIEKSLTETEKSGKVAKSFGYCTDENAGLSIRCNRFDEGTTVTEIAAFHEKRYNDGYKYRNFRNGRAEFSDYGIAQATASRNNMFRSARLVFEEYEFFESIFGKDIMEQGCTPDMLEQYPICKDINDRKAATELIGKMFLDILKTPDLSCALAEASNPGVLLKIVKLNDFYNEKLKYDLEYVPSSCFDKNVVSAFDADGLIVLGEAGRFFGSIKDPNPIYPYESDIAIRGIWVDKLLAMKMLTVRYFGNSSTESIQGALADVGSIKSELMDYISHITLGTPLTNPLAFKDAQGNSFTIPYSIDSSYIIPEQALTSVSRYFALPLTSNVELIKQELFLASHFIKTTDISRRDAADAFVNTLGVYKKGITETFSNSDLETLKLKNVNYAATSSNEIANFIITSSKGLDLLSNLDTALIEKVLNIKKGIFEIPADFSATEAQATKVPVDLLKQVLSIIKKGQVLTEAALIGILGEELGKDTFAAYTLGEAGVLKILSFIETSSAVPAGASAEVKKLYSLDSAILENFLKGELEGKVQGYMNTLQILPALAI